jgi:acetyl-CoA carboxylase alpha subunit
MYAKVKETILKQYAELSKLTPKERISQRIEKFSNMGVTAEAK